MAAWRVYLSSTFLDLEGYREKVLERLRRAQSVTVAMEDYAAFDERPAGKCLADVASCDIYIGIQGRRYGYVPPDDNPEQLSITELEYHRAGNPGPGKPPLKRLMFQLDPGADWPERFCDAKTGDNEAGARVDRFRAEVSARHGIRTFREPDELAGLVLESLLAMLQPQSAWRWPPIWDFGAYMAHKGKDFVGRDWLFRDIDAWLAQPAPRALLIRADFGVGKSAILSELIKRNPGGAIAGWHFCQHDTQDTLAPATFVRSLAGQLAAALPAYRALVESEPALQDRLDKAGDDPASAFEAAIVGPLGRIAPPGGARLLIVDALDEALEVDAATAQRHGTLIRLLANKAGRLPPWLRLLVTSRNNPEVIRPLGTFGLKEIDAENVANQSDLRGYALLRCVREPLAGRLREAGRNADEIADILRDKSLGKFLYTIRALDDLENGSIGPDDLAALPPGMDSFYLDAFERRFARAGRDYAQARDLLGVLALAREPLPAATLAEILGQPASALQAVRRLLPDFIRLRGELWAFDHYSLAEWLTGLDDDGFARAGDHAIDAEASNERFHAWALRKIEDGTVQDSPYLVRHLAMHLTDDDERRRVFAKLMLTSYEWIAARLRLRGVEALIADCKHLGDLVEAPLLRALFRSSAHVLRRYPDQLPAQLIGRIRSLDGPANPLADLDAATLESLEHHTTDSGALRLLPATGSLGISSTQLARFDGHTGWINALISLGDGRLASASEDGTVRIWDADGIREPRILEGHTASVSTLALLTDGRLASGSHDGTVRIWSADEESGVCVLEGHKRAISAILPLDCGRLASGSLDATVRIWNPDSAAAPLVFEAHTDRIATMAALADGRLASGSDDGTVRIWDPEAPGESIVLEEHAARIDTLIALSDGCIASGSLDRTIRIADPDGLRELRFLREHTDRFAALLALADGRLACGLDDGTVQLWDPNGLRETAVLVAGTEPIRALVELADGRLAAGCSDGRVCVLHPDNSSEVHFLGAHSGSVTTLVPLPDARLASGSWDGTVRIWDVDDPYAAGAPSRQNAAIFDIARLADGRLVCASEDGTIRLWDPAVPSEAGILAGHTEMVTSLAALADGRIVSGAFDHTVRVWRTDGSGINRILDHNWGGMDADALVPLADGRVAGACPDSTIRIWDPDGVRDLTCLEGHTEGITALVALDARRLASSSHDHTLRIWNVQLGQATAVLKGHTKPVRKVALLSSGRLVSWSTDGSIRIWDPDGAHAIRIIEGHRGPIWILLALTDGRFAAGYHDGTVRILDPDGACEPRRLDGHTQAVRTLVALADGRITSGSEDGTVRVWDAQTGRQLALFVADAAIHALVACSPNLIAAGDATGAVHFLKLHS